MTNATRLPYSIRTANETLPFLSRVVTEIVALSSEIANTRERLEYLCAGRDLESSEDVYSAELRSIADALEIKQERLRSCYQELEVLEVQVGNASIGFVDFPAKRNDEDVCLCWAAGEKEVLYWHREGEDCSQRKSVDLPLIRQSNVSFISH